MSNDLPDALDRQCAARARSMHEDLGRGLIVVVDGKIHDIELEFVEKHLEGDFKELFETMIRVYDPHEQYVLVVKEKREFKYIGTRNL
jgi:hypothetical protein